MKNMKRALIPIGVGIIVSGILLGLLGSGIIPLPVWIAGFPTGLGILIGIILLIPSRSSTTAAATTSPTSTASTGTTASTSTSASRGPIAVTLEIVAILALIAGLVAGGYWLFAKTHSAYADWSNGKQAEWAQQQEKAADNGSISAATNEILFDGQCKPGKMYFLKNIQFGKNQMYKFQVFDLESSIKFSAPPNGGPVEIPVYKSGNEYTHRLKIPGNLTISCEKKTPVKMIGYGIYAK